MKQTTLALAAAALSLFSFADPRPPAQAHAPFQTQWEMNEEAYAEFQKADGELNRVYSRLVKKLDKPGVARLKKAQRAWLAFRNAEIEFAEDSARGGSMMPQLRFGAAARLTKQRITDLKQHLAEYGGQ